MVDSILLIDLSGIYWTHWHASEGEDISSAKISTINTVTSLAEGFQCCAICLDAPPYKRSEIYPEYKAGREHPEMAIEKLREVTRELRSFGMQVLAAKGYEADDIIATATMQAIKKDVSVYIVSKDKDLLQLSGPNVTITDPFNRKILDIKEKFGLGEPDLVRDFLALMGDKADNIPGVPTIGPKTALKILNIQDVDDILKNGIDKMLPENLAQKIIDNKDQLALSYELVKLHYDAPIEINLESGIYKKPDKNINTIEVKTEEKETDKNETKSNETKSIVVHKSDAIIKSDERNGSWALSIEPENFDQAWKVSQALFASGMFGQFRNAQSILAILMRGRAIGIDSTTALSSFHVIEGRPTMHASLIVGLVLKSNKAEYFDLIESTDTKAIWVTKRIRSKNETKMEYTIEEADRAGLLRPSRSGKPTNWQTRPKTMLRWRAATELARAVYPDVVTGLYTPEEMEDGATYEY